MLTVLVILLLTIAVAVPLSRRAGMGSVLGYLVGGAVIGPAGLGLVANLEQIEPVSQFGIIMLLFLIGLELRPARLWVLRRAVFGLGSAQMAVTTALLAAALRFGLFLPWAASVALAAGLALSSTAIVLPMLGERGLMDSRAGRSGFGVLLFQDLSFIPLVALVPLLGGDGGGGLAALPHAVPWRGVLLGLGALGAILLGGLVLLPRVFRLIGGARTPEVFVATALLIVAGTAWLAQAAGLSMSLGAFLAGVLLSNSEYRHELQADIEPFEGVLLGFFFLSVGVKAQLGLLAAAPVAILGGVAALMAAKTAVGLALARIMRQDVPDTLRFALSLAQGSEFSFVLFGAAATAGVLDPGLGARATLVVALSMAMTPVLFAAGEALLARRAPAEPPPDDELPAGTEAPVIICGFGRMGQIVGRVLRTQNIRYVALESDPTQVDVLRRFGTKVFYGDPGRVDLLRAAGADSARLLVVALGDPEEVLRVVDAARRNFPDLPILARARNRRAAHLLMERGVRMVVRETFHSALEMTALALDRLGTPPDRAATVLDGFRRLDEQALVDTVPIRDDESRLVQNAKQLNQELIALLSTDRPAEPATGR